MQCTAEGCKAIDTPPEEFRAGEALQTYMHPTWTDHVTVQLMQHYRVQEGHGTQAQYILPFVPLGASGTIQGKASTPKRAQCEGECAMSAVTQPNVSAKDHQRAPQAMQDDGNNPQDWLTEAQRAATQMQGEQR